MLQVVLLVLLGPAFSAACNGLITAKIEVVEEGVLDYIKGKTFIDVSFGGNKWLNGYLSENVFCSWTSSIDDKITYKRKKLSRIGEVRVYQKLRSGLKTWKSVVVTKPLTMSVDKGGVISEKDSKGVVKSYVYPMYLNKDAGVYAYHRCSESNIPMNRKWWTVITVDKEKFGDPPMQILDPNTWAHVLLAVNKIKEVEAITKSEVLGFFDNPDRCVFSKEWPSMKPYLKKDEQKKEEPKVEREEERDVTEEESAKSDLK